MPNLKDLKNRIASVKSTRKITKAMQMVAAAKLNTAEIVPRQRTDNLGRGASLNEGGELSLGIVELVGCDQGGSGLEAFAVPPGVAHDAQRADVQQAEPGHADGKAEPDTGDTEHPGGAQGNSSPGPVAPCRSHLAIASDVDELIPRRGAQRVRQLHLCPVRLGHSECLGRWGSVVAGGHQTRLWTRLAAPSNR